MMGIHSIVLVGIRRCVFVVSRHYRLVCMLTSLLFFLLRPSSFAPHKRALVHGAEHQGGLGSVVYALGTPFGPAFTCLRPLQVQRDRADLDIVACFSFSPFALLVFAAALLRAGSREARAVRSRVKPPVIFPQAATLALPLFG